MPQKCSKLLVRIPPCYKSSFFIKIILFSRKSRNAAIKNVSITVADNKILAKPYVRDLGFFIDSHLTLDEHVRHINKSAFWHLRIISKVRRFLNTSQTLLLVHALVFSRLNFCASTFMGMSKKNLAKLQKIQNYSMRLVYRLPKSTNVQSILERHKLLPVNLLSKLRLSMLVRDVLLHNSPKQLASLLTPLQQRDHMLRSNNAGHLYIPRTNSVAGDKAFAVSAPRLFNDLPNEAKIVLTKRKKFKSTVSK
jgi:hypothetical protein